jgi:hypothetical protein
MASLRTRSMSIITLVIFFLLLMTYSLRGQFLSTNLGSPKDVKIPKEFEHPPEHIIPEYPTYKLAAEYNLPLIVDNFPLAAIAHSTTDLPPIPL